MPPRHDNQYNGYPPAGHGYGRDEPPQQRAPAQSSGPRQGCSVFVGGVPVYYDDTMFEGELTKYGRIVKAQIQRDSQGRGRGFGIVEFVDAATAQRVLNEEVCLERISIYVSICLSACPPFTRKERLFVERGVGKKQCTPKLHRTRHDTHDYCTLHCTTPHNLK